MSTAYYKQGDGFLATKGKSPRGFRGVLVVVYTGKTPDDIKEEAQSVQSLKKLEQVDSVPEEWAEALENYGFKRPSPRVEEVATLPLEVALLEDREEEEEEPVEPLSLICAAVFIFTCWALSLVIIDIL